MNYQTHQMSHETAQAEPFKEGAMECTCLAQVLVVDRTNGPADVLTDLIARLFEGQVSVMQASNHEDALYALNCADFDLVILGVETCLESDELDQLAVLPDLRHDFPDQAVIAVGRNLSRFDLERCRAYRVNDAVEMPRRAAELKALVTNIMGRYLQCLG